MKNKRILAIMPAPILHYSFFIPDLFKDSHLFFKAGIFFTRLLTEVRTAFPQSNANVPSKSLYRRTSSSINLSYGVAAMSKSLFTTFLVLKEQHSPISAKRTSYLFFCLYEKPREYNLSSTHLSQSSTVSCVILPTESTTR